MPDRHFFFILVKTTGPQELHLQMVRTGSSPSLFLIFASQVTNWGMILSPSSTEIITGSCMGQKQINNGKTQPAPVWIWGMNTAAGQWSQSQMIANTKPTMFLVGCGNPLQSPGWLHPSWQGSDKVSFPFCSDVGVCKCSSQGPPGIDFVLWKKQVLP